MKKSSTGRVLFMSEDSSSVLREASPDNGDLSEILNLDKLDRTLSGLHVENTRRCTNHLNQVNLTTFSLDIILFLVSGEPIHVSGPATRLGNDQRKFSVISFTSPGKIKFFSKFYWIDSI